MEPIECLKMLKSKIDAARINECNYAIETSDIKAINESLATVDVTAYFNGEQIKRVSKMLVDISRSAFIQGGGTESEYQEWWINRNKVNMNGV